MNYYKNSTGYVHSDYIQVGTGGVSMETYQENTSVSELFQIQKPII